MAKRRHKAGRGQAAGNSPADQLDLGVEATMANARSPRVNPGIAALLRVAGELRGLPRPDFKARLKADLKKSAAAAKSSKAAPAARPHGVATPYLMIRDASRALDFYKRAFGATELMRMADPTGHIAHAEIKVGDAPIMIADEAPESFNVSPQSLGGSSAFIHVYVDDVDAFARRAERGGAKVLEAPEDYPYGDRRGKFVDPFGHVWMVATHKQDVTAEQMKADWDRSVAAEKAKQPVPKPEGFHSVTPYLHVKGAAEFIDFLKRAFGADELMRVHQPDGSIAHAQMRVSGSIIELADFTPSPASIWLFVDDVDATYERALKAGATSIHGPMDQDYGNREASVKDPFGNHWYLAKQLETADPWPVELRSVTPYLHPKGADKLVDFLKKAFDAEEAAHFADDKGVVQHAQMKIGDSIVAMGEAHGEYPAMPFALHLYVRDADATYRRALQAGAKSAYAPRDEAYGDRSSGVTDPLGNTWYIATYQDPQRREAASAPDATYGGASQERGPAIMPFMYCEDTAAAADFYKKVFAAKELHREVQEQGRASHVQLDIGGTRVMLSDATMQHSAEAVAKGFVRTPHQLGGTPLHLYVYVPDCDAAFKRALDSGSEIVDEMEDQQWGDRCGGVRDPFGHIWYIATPLKDVQRKDR